MKDLCSIVTDAYEKASRDADEIKEKVAGKYSAKWPFLNDEEFGDVFAGYEIPENSKCMNSCYDRDRCCPKACYFLSEKLDGCGIYEYRPIECRLYFCGGSGTELWALKNILPFKVGKTQFSALIPELEKKALEIKAEFINNEISSKKAKQEWKNIIQDYRNRKI